MLAFALVSLAATTSSRAQSGADDAEDLAALSSVSEALEIIAARVGPSIVQIVATGYGPGAGTTLAKQHSGGSGVILDEGGYIVTNAHVVAGADHVQVLLASPMGETDELRSILKPRGESLDADIVGIDRETDLAVLKVDAPDLRALELADSDGLRPGQMVMAFGSPLGLENSVTLGVVSSVARQLQPDAPMIYIQTDAPINPGSSGGPLVDTEGRVVGINTLIFSQSGGNEGIGFAAPSNIVRAVYEQLATTGRVRRGMIGVNAQTITPPMAKALRLPRQWGVVLGDVYPGSPAEIAGLRVGDIILTLDGKAMENGRQFDVNVYRRRAGETIRLGVLRSTGRDFVTVEVVERPADYDQFVEMVDPETNLIAPLGILAMNRSPSVERLLPSLRQRGGVVVAARSPGGPLGGRFEPGDVIYAFNETQIATLEQLRERVKRLASGDAVVVQIEREGTLMFLAFELE